MSAPKRVIVLADGVDVRAIPGYDEYYATEDGRVISDHPRYKHPRFLKLRKQWDGYLMVQLYKDEIPHYVLVHRVVLLAFVGAPPPGHVACRYNSDRADNRLCNLYWGTLASSVEKRTEGWNRKQPTR